MDRGSDKNMRKIFKKMLKRGSKKVVDTTANIVSRSPEAASLSETLIKRITTYAYLGEKLAHFHLVVFGVILGFSFMTAIIAFGKLAIVLEVSIFSENRDLIFNFGYLSLFLGTLLGFLKHYASSHHGRSLRNKSVRLEQDFKQKISDLEIDFKEKKESLEEEFLERTKVLGAMIKKQEQELKELAETIKLEKNKSTVWETISTYNPVKILKK